MIGYYFFTLLVTVIAIFSRRWVLFFLLLGVSVFLYALPSTEADYEYYQEAYENSFFSSDFPWFKTRSLITAEAGYLFYNSFFGVLFPLGFSFFLSLNFIICSVIVFVCHKCSYIKNIDLFWISFLPVIIPTIFYFSPRSSISLMLVMFGLVCLCNDKLIYSMIGFFLGCVIHSQYIPISLFLVLSYVFVFRLGGGFKKEWIIVLMGVGLFMIILNANQLVTIFQYFLSFMPSSKVAVGKLHMLESAREGFRVTSLFSLIVYPLFLFLVFRKKRRSGCLIFTDCYKRDERFLYLFCVIVVFGFVINLAFINNPHLSGRLSRFSDYMSMGILLPAFLTIYFGRTLSIAVLAFFAVIAPVVYPTLYNF